MTTPTTSLSSESITRSATPMTEKEFMVQVRQLAALLRWRCYHTHDSRRSPEGFPDLVLCRGRRLLFAELKAARGQFTEAQERWLAALAATGSEVYRWRPANWAEIEEVLG